MRAKTMLNVISRILILTLIMAVTTAPLAPRSYAESTSDPDTSETGGGGGGGTSGPTFPPAQHKSCGYVKNYPCPELLNQRVGDHETGQITDDGSAAAFCKMLETNDKSCTQAEYMFYAYGAVAAFCTMACFNVLIVSRAATEMACAWGGIAVSVFDMGWGMKNAGEVQTWTRKRSDAMENDLMSQGLGGAGFVANVGTQIVSRAVAGAGTSALTGSGSSAARATSCVSMVINGALAGVRLWNWQAIQDSSNRTYGDMCRVHEGNCSTVQRVKQEESNKQFRQRGSSLASSPPPQAPVASSTVDDFTNAIQAALDSGELAENFAQAGYKNGAGPSDPKKALATALKGLNERGISPAMLARSLAADGLAGTLSKMPGVDAATKDDFKKFEDATKKLSFGGSQFAFDGGSGSARKSGGGASDPFAGLMGNRGPAQNAGGAQAVKFGGFNGDIWHAGSQKSIFEIVRDKTQAVTSRVLD